MQELVSAIYFSSHTQNNGDYFMGLFLVIDFESSEINVIVILFSFYFYFSPKQENNT